MKYRSGRALARLLVVSHFVAALAMVFVLGEREVFPLFSWMLFPSTPGKTVGHYVALVTSIDDVPVRPINLARSGSLGTDSILAFMLVQEIGGSTASGNPNPAKLRTLEHGYLSRFGDSMCYEIGLETFDPIARWNTGKTAYRTLYENCVSR